MTPDEIASIYLSVTCKCRSVVSRRQGFTHGEYIGQPDENRQQKWESVCIPVV